MEINVKNVLIGLAILAGITCLLMAASPKVTLVIDGQHNIAYAEAINQTYNEGLKTVSHETVRLANAYISDRAIGRIVLLDPTVQKIKDFYELAQAHGAKLIVGSAYNETELKAQLFELGLDNKKVQFQTDQDWDPDNVKNVDRDYTY